MNLSSSNGRTPRKIAWTILYRRMHKKGVTEEIAKKRTRKTVKHQRGIVGADLNTILARRNQTASTRADARLQAVSKAKEEKKSKEATKTKTKASSYSIRRFWDSNADCYSGSTYRRVGA